MIHLENIFSIESWKRQKQHNDIIFDVVIQ